MRARIVAASARWVVTLGLALTLASVLGGPAPRAHAARSSGPASALTGPAQTVEGVEALLWWPGRSDSGSVALRALVDLLESAEHTIDVTVHDCKHPEIRSALLRAMDRGVAVRLVAKQGCTSWLRTASLQAMPAHVTASLMHHKFIVVDGLKVWTGSANFTEKTFESNAENAVLITSPTVAEAFIEAFERLLPEYSPDDSGTEPAESSLTVGDIEVELWFTPWDDPEQAIVEALAGAEHSIYVSMFTLTNDTLTEALVAAARERGVHVVVLLDDAGAGNNGSDKVALCRNGIEVREDDFTGTMHNKFAVIDAVPSVSGTHSASGATPSVITGSANWSASGMTSNDENVMRLRDRALAETYFATWQELSAHSKANCPVYLPALTN